MPTVQFVPHLSVPFPHADVYKLVDDIELEGLTAFALVSYDTECHLYQLLAYATHASMIELLVIHHAGLVLLVFLLVPYMLRLPIVESSFCACNRLVKLMGLQENDDFGLRISSIESLSVMTEVIQFTSPFT